MHTINAQDAMQLLKNDEAILIDVRSPEEFSQAHISYAKLIPLSDLSETLHSLAIPSTKKVIFQCQKGMRGAKACEQAEAMDLPNEIINLNEGIEGWQQAGLPTLGKQASKAKRTIMQQVQITFGVLIILLSTLAFMGISSAFILITLLGVGMLFSGLTGWCGLALLLTKMPWNK